MLARSIPISFLDNGKPTDVRFIATDEVTC